MFRSLFSRKRSSGEITPDDIFLDASNLPGLDVEQFEGRIEHPVSPVAVWFVGITFLAVVVAFGWQAFSLQVRQGAQFAAVAQENRLAHSLLFAERGVIYDRTGLELAWNERSEILPYALRHYSALPGVSHILGYVRYPKADNSGVWWRTDLSGVSGAELIFDAALGGTNGTEMAEVDAHNVVQRRSLIEPPKDGRSVTLSIDAELQSRLHEILAAHIDTHGFEGGSGVVMDVKTGEIIALTNVPEYSSQALTDGVRDIVEGYSTDSHKPFLNRAISGAYTPGSIVKPLFAAAALAEEIIDPRKTIFSPGFITIPNPYNPDQPTIIKDWRAHGWTDMREAIAVSSDVYFFSIGGGYEGQAGLGISRLDKYAGVFGLGKKTGIDFAGEVSGVIPTPEWKQEIFGEEEPWRLGDTYNTSIGQYGFQVTPLQMARAIAAIANGGALPEPRLIASSTPDLLPTRLNDEHLQVIREGMRAAVTSGAGTARAINIGGFPIAGKTGTAEVGNRKQWMNSWVVGFWPYDEPRYSFAIVLERAPAGTLSGAAPAMRPFFEWLAHRDDIVAPPVPAQDTIQPIE